MLGAVVERHHEVGSERTLHRHRPFRAEEDLRAVDGGAEPDPRRRTRPTCVHRLIAFGVLLDRLAANVRGKWHRTVALDEPVDIVDAGDFQLEQLLAPRPHHEAAVGLDRQKRAALRRLAGAQPCKHAVGGENALDKDLDATSGRLGSEESAPNDLWVVGDDEVAGTEVFSDVREGAVGDASRPRVEDQQPAVAAPGSRKLRNQLLRQLVVEIRDAHGRRW